MKKFIIIFSFLVIFFIPRQSFAYSDYIVEKFDSNILIHQDTTVSVIETIQANFLYEKHGIFRTLPVIYSAKRRSINSHLQVTSVTDENGNPYPYTVNRLAQSIQLIIGDPNTTTKGVHTYKIYYRLKGVLLRYDGVPEFYWNVTGHEWDTEITSVSATVTSSHTDFTEMTCFTGVFGSKLSDCEKTVSESGVTFTTSNVTIGHDFTIAIKLNPENSLIFPTGGQLVTNTIFDNWGYLPAVFPFFMIVYLWYKRGRDEKYVGENYYYKPDNPKTETVSIFARGHIPLVYHPLDSLTPSQVGTVMDERIDIADVIAEIVELARLKFIKIEKLPKKSAISKTDYAFTKLKKDTAGLRDYQLQILKELFREHVQHGSVFEVAQLIKDALEQEKALKNMVGKDYVTLSSLKNHFYAGLTIIKKKVYSSLSEMGIFDGNPETVSAKYIGGYMFVVIVFAFITGYYSVNYFNFIPLVILVLGGLGGLVFAYSMPKKTAWGFSVYKQALGLREYLKVGKWRHEHYEKKLFFEEMIPLAISLGVVDKLAGDMKELGIEPPRYMSGFVMSHFASDLASFKSAAASTFVSAPGGSGRSSWSGGSGFSGGGSGGGFGGGGGGSW